MTAAVAAVTSAGDQGAVTYFDIPPFGEIPRLVKTFQAKASFNAPRGTAVQSTPFSENFFATIAGHGSGLMTMFLYSDPDNEYLRKKGGGQAWQEYVSEGTEGSGGYDIAVKDIIALRYAADHGLFAELPGRIDLFEYGTGGKSGVDKPMALAGILSDLDKTVQGYYAVDILKRFAWESAQEVNERLGIESHVIVGDFMTSRSISMPEVGRAGSNRVVAVFGGTFANAPALHNGIRRAPLETASSYFSKMSAQHGVGSSVVLTYHSERDPGAILSQYEQTPAFRSFVLSYLFRALAEKVITDPHYDPLRYWGTETVWDPDLSALRVNTVCREEHDMPTSAGVRHFEKGHSMTSSLCNKWNEADYTSILKKAGYEPRFCRKEGESMGVLVAKAVRPPEM